LYRTAGAGVHWHRIALPARIARGSASSVDFTTDGIGYVYGPRTWLTRDGGRHWRELAGRPTEALSIDGARTYRVAYHGSGCPGPCHPVVQEAPTGSDHWQTIDRPGFFGDGAAISTSGDTVLVTFPANPASGAANEQTTYVESTDRGRSWQQHHDPCGGSDRHEWDTMAVSVLRSRIAAACTLRGRPAHSAIVVSSDDGRHFNHRRRTPILSAGAIGETPGRILVGTSTISGAGRITFKVAATTTSERRWTVPLVDHTIASDADDDLFASIVCSSHTCAYLADPQHLYISTNSGHIWRRRKI
jgi:hypothetical protein